MKILVFGSNGFIGRTVVKTLTPEYEVYKGDRSSDGGANSFVVDLLDQASIISILDSVKPEVIINCAGTVENTEKALSINPIITLNILQSVQLKHLSVKKIIICGSAGEYGIVENEGPVSEETPLMGTSFYARSKVLESSAALAFAGTTNLPVIVARIFNPIGVGMHPRFLLPNLIGQVREIKSGKRKTVELSRLDAKRDYINVLDIAEAIKLLIESDNTSGVYNVGSGQPITNQQLLNGIFEQQGVPEDKYTLSETCSSPEPNYAVDADISKITKEVGWVPKYDIQTTIKQIAEELNTKE